MQASAIPPSGLREPGFIPGRPVATLIALGFVMFVGAIHSGALSSGRDVLLWAHDYVLHDNFHEVVPGRLYRSAEMSHERLAATIRDKGIATVVDLRNGKPDADGNGWTEPAVVARAGATYVHVPLLGGKIPSRARLLELLDVFDRSARPVLVHCSSGALRTGVASAIWLLAEEGATPDGAVAQLDLRYGYTHLESELRRRQHGFEPLVALLDDYEAATRTDGITFRAWVESGSDGYNVAGIRHFVPRGTVADAS